jgi:hypothetical protein
MMRNVKPIELDLEAIPETAAEVVEKYFERRIDEIDALVSLLGLAHRHKSGHATFGYDLDCLDEIVLRRVRKLTRSCQNAVSAVLNYDPENPPTAESFGAFED